MAIREKPRNALRRSVGASGQTRTPDYIPGGGQVNIVSANPSDHSVQLSLPGMAAGSASGEVLAVEVSTKPFIGLVWIGAIITLTATFLVVVRRAQEMFKLKQLA